MVWFFFWLHKPGKLHPCLHEMQFARCKCSKIIEHSVRELSITASRHQLVQAKKANSTGVAQCAIREGEIIAGRGIKYII